MLILIFALEKPHGLVFCFCFPYSDKIILALVAYIWWGGIWHLIDIFDCFVDSGEYTLTFFHA